MTNEIRVRNEFTLYEKPGGVSCRLQSSDKTDVGHYTPENIYKTFDDGMDWEHSVEIRLPQQGEIHFQIVKQDENGKIRKLFYKATPDGVFLA